MNRFIGIIPARYKSTRFPGKPLANIKGMSMIRRVYEKASEALEEVVVATDDRKIYEHVLEFGGKVVMTSELHQSGTDRCFEALNTWSDITGFKFDVVINIQGDEPFIRKEQIQLLKGCFENTSVQIATLIKEVVDSNVIFDSNRPKVVVKKNGEALYFSRSPIPFLRGEQKDEWNKKHRFFQHIGMYAYRSEVLQEITSLEPGTLETAESLEQLRWLENGFKIQTVVTDYESFGIDTPEDLETVLKMNLL